MSKEKRLTAIELLAMGLSQSEVARKIGVTRQAVSVWCKDENFNAQVTLKRQEFSETNHKEHSEVLQEPITSKSNLVPFPRSPNSYQLSREVGRQQELHFLEEIQNHLLPLLHEGSIRAAAALLKISDQRSKLLGLYQKNLPLLEAVSQLLGEGVMTVDQAVIVEQGVMQLIDKLEEYASENRRLEENGS